MPEKPSLPSVITLALAGFFATYLAGKLMTRASERFDAYREDIAP